jgi:prepilin-type N-terminal cleavage/methylation domain-containing protein
VHLRKNHRRHGVSLLELLAVLFILGVLWTVFPLFIKKFVKADKPLAPAPVNEMRGAVCDRPDTSKLPPLLEANAATLRRWADPKTAEADRSTVAIEIAKALNYPPTSDVARWSLLAPIVRDWDKRMVPKSMIEDGSAIVRGGLITILSEQKPDQTVHRTMNVYNNNGTIKQTELPGAPLVFFFWPCGTGTGDRLLAFENLVSPDAPINAYVDGELWKSALTRVACKTQYAQGVNLVQQGTHCIAGWIADPQDAKETHYDFAQAAMKDIFDTKHNVTTLSSAVLVLMREWMSH